MIKRYYLHLPLLPRKLITIEREWILSRQQRGETGNWMVPVVLSRKTQKQEA